MLAPSFVFRKQNERLLISLISENLLPDVLIVLTSSHLWAGGILVLWNSSVFSGVVLDKQRFGITVAFNSVHNREAWMLTTVCGPCDEPARSEFIRS